MPTRPAMFFLIGTVHLSPDIKIPIPVDPGNPGTYQRFMWNATHNPFELTEVNDWYELITIDYPACTFEAGYSHNVGRTNLRAAINARPGPFVLAGVSQGAGVISHVYNDLRTGDMQDRRADLIRGLAIGNPWRQAGRSLPFPNAINPDGHGMSATRLTGTEELWWECAANGDIVCTNGDDPFSLLVQAVYEWTYANYTGSADALWSAAQAFFTGVSPNELMDAINTWLRVFTNLNGQTNPHLAYMDFKPVVGDNRTAIEIATADLIMLAKSMGVGPSEASVGWFAENFITLNGIPSAEAFGKPAISSGQALRLTGIPSAEAIGKPKLSPEQFIRLNGIPSAEAVGQVNPSWLQEMTLSGIPSAEAIGVPNITENKVITLDGIPSAEAFGDIRLGQGIKLIGIPTQQGFGAPNLIPGGVSMRLTGIPSAEAIGKPKVVPPIPPFTPFTETNVARNHYPLPAGSVGCWVTAIAKGGNGGAAASGTATDRGGGGGGGSGGKIARTYVDLTGSSFYSVKVGDTVEITTERAPDYAVVARLTANKGNNGGPGSGGAGGSGGSGGSIDKYEWTTGVQIPYGYGSGSNSGSAGGDGGNGASSQQGSAGSNGSGGGGGGTGWLGGGSPGGAGGNADAAGGAQSAAAGAANPGSSSSTGRGGGGGGGGGEPTKVNNGGKAGDYGGGGGGAGASNNTTVGGAGGARIIKVEWV